jgi:hypothetical protein
MPSNDKAGSDISGFLLNPAVKESRETICKILLNALSYCSVTPNLMGGSLK